MRAVRLLPLLLGACIAYGDGELPSGADGGASSSSSAGGIEGSSSSGAPSSSSASTSGSSGSTSSSASSSSSSSSGSTSSSASSSGAPGTCALPWGGTLDDGGTVTAYANATVAYGQSCEGQQRQCNDGVLSGSFTAQTCAPAVPNQVSCQGEVVFSFPECNVPCTRDEDDTGKYLLGGSPTIGITYGGSVTVNGYCGGRTLRCMTEDGALICVLGEQAIVLPPP